MTELALKIPSPTWSEAERLAVLRDFAILDTDPEKSFDDLVKVAARTCHAPVAFIAFVDEDRQWIKASVGIDRRSTPRDAAFCEPDLLGSDLFIVPDGFEDPRFAHNPIVRGEPALRFYAGATIRTDDGLPLGAVCVLDQAPRPDGLTRDQAETLMTLAAMVMSLLKLRQAETRQGQQPESVPTWADALPQILWSADSDGCGDYINRRWQEFTGAPARSASERGWIEMLHPDDRDQTWIRWQHSTRTGEPFETTCRLQHHAGEYRWVLARAMPTYDAQGRIARWFGTFTDIHDWKAAETDAAQSCERYKALLDASAVVLWLAAPDGMLTHLEGTIEFGGLSESAYIGTGWLQSVHPDDRIRAKAAWQWAVSSGSNYQSEFRIKLADGQYRWMLAHAVALKNADGTIREWVGSVADIHDRRKAKEELRESAERLRLALHAGRMFAWEQDLTTDYVTRSQNAVTLLGIGSGPLSEFLEKVHPEDRALRQRFAQQVKVQGSYMSEFRYILPSGKVLWFGSRAELTSPDRVVGVTFDITDRKSAEEEIWRTANHDALTGLSNRALFQRGLEEALAKAKQGNGCIGLLLIDLDDFKDVNDTLGHDAGDALLRETAARLTRLIGENDTVARLGGDEFAVLMTSPRTLDDAARFAERVVEELRKPFTYRRRLISSHASIGVAAFPDHHSEPAELMKSADIALYRAKAQGRNRVLAYSPSMRREIEERVSLGNNLREALARNQLVPFYQPKISLATGKIVGLEALARWQHPTRGLLTPGVFGAAFEDADLAPAIRRQLVPKIAADMRTWIDRGLAFGRVAVNLASADFNQPQLVEEILETFASQNVPPDFLEVEITETVLLGRSSESVSAILARFRSHGVQIALDDFGTGYASLTHLKQFPVDHVKIDRSFIQDLDRGTEDEAIVAAVIGLGRSLNLQITAEGVETQKQEHRLRRLGCDHGQGYLYSGAVAGAELTSLLAGP